MWCGDMTLMASTLMILLPYPVKASAEAGEAEGCSPMTLPGCGIGSRRGGLDSVTGLTGDAAMSINSYAISIEPCTASPGSKLTARSGSDDRPAAAGHHRLQPVRQALCRRRKVVAGWLA